MADYQAIADELKDLVNRLGKKKAEIQQLFDRGGDSPVVQAAIEDANTLVARLKDRAAQTPITEQERQRKMAGLQARIDELTIIDASSPDFDRRMDAEREMSRLTAELGVFESQKVMQFDQLLGEDDMRIATLLRQAQMEIAARQDLARVLKGVEVALRAGSFVATLASKLAIARAVG
jgi:hypothetical protein